jgi:hypothetical protein
MSGETFLGQEDSRGTSPPLGPQAPDPQISTNPPVAASDPSADASSADPGSRASGPGGAAPPNWITDLPEDARGYVENKGWKEPGDVLKGYRQLEEFLGADKAGRGILLPKDEKDQEALDKIYTALGRPEKAEGYELTELMAQEETDPAFMSAMAQAMHGAGLSKTQARNLATAYQAHFKADRQAAAEDYQRQLAEASRTLSPEEKEYCQRGFKWLGLPERDATAIEMYWGVAKAAQMFAKIGKALGEDKRVDGTAAAGFGGSPEAAKSRIAELQADPSFTKRYLNGEPEACRIMDGLFKTLAQREQG